MELADLSNDRESALSPGRKPKNKCCVCFLIFIKIIYVIIRVIFALLSNILVLFVLAFIGFVLLYLYNEGIIKI